MQNVLDVLQWVAIFYLGWKVTTLSQHRDEHCAQLGELQDGLAKIAPSQFGHYRHGGDQ